MTGPLKIQKNVNGAITNLHWEGDNMSFELNENYQPIRRYIYENGKDDVQAHVEYAEIDDPQYFSFERKGWYSYIKDQVGTITKVYKHETKQMINTRTYDTFGNLINQTGSSNGNLGFQSKYFDQESGLNYYYQRYYYPSIGRFLRMDPLKFSSGVNFYSFIDNDPIDFFDPYGFKVLDKNCHLFKRTKLFTMTRTDRSDREPLSEWKLIVEKKMDTPASTGNIIGDMVTMVQMLTCVYQREIQVITRKYIRNINFDIYFCKKYCFKWVIFDISSSPELLGDIDIEKYKETFGFKVIVGIGFD